MWLLIYHKIVTVRRPEITETRAPQATLPEVEDAVLADMSGVTALSQHELWQRVAGTGHLGAWALSEASRVQKQGTTPEDAFLTGVGYAVTALKKQLKRDTDGVTARQLESLLDDAASGP